MQYVSLIEVFVAAVASMIAGVLWYSPILFGKQWLEERQAFKVNSGESNRGSKKLSSKISYILSFIADLITAASLLSLIGYSGLSSYTVSLIAFFGFMLPIIFGSIIYEGKSWTLFMLTAGYRLVSMLLMATVFTFF